MGGLWNLSPLTLNNIIITFLVCKQKPPNFVTLPEIYLRTIWYDVSLVTELDASIATIFNRHIFSDV